MCEAKRYKDALDLFDYFFGDSKMKPFRGYFNHFIKYHLDRGCLEEALDLYDSSLANSATGSLITKGLVDSGKLDEAMDRLKRLGFDSLSSDVCNFLFKGILRLGDVEKANEVLGEIKERSLGEYGDKVVVLSSALMEYWFEKGNEEEGVKCYSDLKLRKVKEATTVNGILELLLKYGKKIEAWSVFLKVLDSEEMNDLDSDTVNVMVNECFETGRFKEVVDIFNQVKAVKLKYPKVTCYRYMISRFCERGMLLEAERFFEEMCADKLVKPDVSTYFMMVEAYHKAGRNEDLG